MQHFATYNEFIRREMETWGEDYILDLLSQGYEAILTNAGWKWIMPQQERGRLGRPTLVG